MNKDIRYEIVHDMLCKILRRTDTASRDDVHTFNDYAERRIDLEECMETFFLNNHVKDEDIRRLITPDAFKLWLLSLGYRRYGE